MSECKESYAEYLEKLNNKIDENEPIITYNSKLSNSLQLGLECMTSKSQTGHVGKAANSSNTACQQHTLNENPALIQPAGCNMFNVQLNYNYNQALDPELWDGNFYVVSLRRSMEHLASDTQNIKKSLTRI